MDDEMQYQLKSFIEGLKADRRISSFDEASTKQAVILRILSLLAWDTFNVDEVTPEYSIAGRKVDFSLRIGNVNKVFIEVKKLAEELEGHQEQLLNYSFQEGIKLAVLTNGATWWFYLPLHEGSWEQRKFYTIDILQQGPEDVVSKFIDFLSKENVSSGIAIKIAEDIFKGQQKQNIIRATLPEAWNKIISESDELLIELISDTTEKLCGYKADSGSVEKFLTKYMDQFVIVADQRKKVSIPPHKRLKQVATKATPGSYSGKSISAFSFRGAKYDVRSWKDLLLALCSIINTSHRSEFDRTLNLVGRKRPYFTRNIHELRAPQRIDNTNIFVETNLSANSIMKLCHDLLSLFGYSMNDLTIAAH